MSSKKIIVKALVILACLFLLSVSTYLTTTCYISSSSGDDNYNGLYGTYQGRGDIGNINLGSESESEFTVVVLPDTQFYSQSYPEIFESQTSWIVDNKDALNIKFVVHTGDIVNDGGDINQWNNADSSMCVLDGIVPYIVVPGNHDYNNNCADSPKDASNFNAYFPYSRFEGYKWYGGHYPSDGNENNYGFFSFGNQEFLVIGLEFCPTDEVLAWTDNLIINHSDKKVILFTHSYMNYDNTRVDPGDFFHCKYYGCCNTSYNDGEDMWSELVSNHSNIVLILSGHIPGLGRRIDYVDGQPIHQILQNYQMLENGGNGWLRYYTFKPDGKIEARTYSPYLNAYETSYNNEFDLSECEGDFERDGDVDGRDVVWFKTDIGREDSETEPLCNGDFDCDGDVDGRDVGIFKTDAGREGCLICSFSCDYW